MTKRTITLSGRPPVSINENNWPLIASASDKEFDNQYEFQANRISKWFIGVRQHADGRILVYATYSYSSSWQDARDYSAKAGAIFDGDTEVATAIERVVDDISAKEHHAEDESRWNTIRDECIADLPVQELD